MRGGKKGVVVLTTVPLALSLMMSWPVLTTSMPLVDAEEMGRKISQSRHPVGDGGFRKSSHFHRRVVQSVLKSN